MSCTRSSRTSTSSSRFLLWIMESSTSCYPSSNGPTWETCKNCYLQVQKQMQMSPMCVGASQKMLPLKYRNRLCYPHRLSKPTLNQRAWATQCLALHIAAQDRQSKVRVKSTTTRQIALWIHMPKSRALLMDLRPNHNDKKTSSWEVPCLREEQQMSLSILKLLLERRLVEMVLLKTLCRDIYLKRIQIFCLQSSSMSKSERVKSVM